MTQQADEIRKYITSWEGLSLDKKRIEIPKIINLLCQEDGFLSPKVEILVVGPPNVRGFYDISKDTIYVNAYLLDHTNFKPVIRSLSHLVRYKGQMQDVIKYLKVLQDNPDAKTNPKYEQVRALKGNLNNYFYPWGKKDIVPKEENPQELFWVSSNEEIDWNELIAKS